MKELSDDYDITVDNMFSIDLSAPIFWGTDYESKGYSLKESKFYNSKNVLTPMTILSNNKGKQIFWMKDTKFILEVEKEGEVEYFYSEKLKDLLS